MPVSIWSFGYSCQNIHGERNQPQFSNIISLGEHVTNRTLKQRIYCICTKIYYTASTAASAGPLIDTKQDSIRRRYPCSGAMRWGW